MMAFWRRAAFNAHRLHGQIITILDLYGETYFACARCGSGVSRSGYVRARLEFTYSVDDGRGTIESREWKGYRAG